jgi:hypothetical protein
MAGMAKSRLTPKVNPVSLVCPDCKAEPGKDCKAKPGKFSVLHLARIAAASAKDADDKHKRDKLGC